MRMVADSSDGGGVQQTLRSLLFTSVLIKWFKATELNGCSQITELDHHRVQDGLKTPTKIQIWSQVAVWCGSALSSDTQGLCFSSSLIWLQVCWHFAARAQVWSAVAVCEVWGCINFFFSFFFTQRTCSRFWSISQEFPEDKRQNKQKTPSPWKRWAKACWRA